ncbi:MAG: AAA family ATPase [Acidobacteria bacterium]|nr:AAA family ATPase [Acidobacteriota bacterium]
MATTARKYNPGFLTDEELVALFCVRTTEFELLAGALRECTGSANQHQLVIGPRGSGKTSLLLRVAAEIRRDPGLAARCFPIVFAEESYEVSTAGEFWLECLSHLAGQYARRDDDPDLQRTVNELRANRNDQLLADQCLGALLDFADRHDKRLLLLVENLNTLFQDMSDRDAGWKLRKVLQTEPRIILFASATSRFEEIDNPDRALYDLFQVRTLRPLNTEQCAVLWETVAGRQPARPTVRALEILTGGNPRLVAIVARFGAGLSFRELMADLLDVVDDHTEYFRSHLESLPAQERRVYLALASLWKPATTREIAERARLDTSTCSAQLARLAERGVVQVAGGSVRRKQYYLTERLYNIYYLLRRRRGPDPLVEALIHFMESYYSPNELKSIATGIALDVKRVDRDARALHKAVLARLVQLPGLAEFRSALLDVASEEALAILNEAIRRFGASQRLADMTQAARALATKSVLLRELRRPDEALDACDELASRFGGTDAPAVLEFVARGLVNKGDLLVSHGRFDQAVAVSDYVLHRCGAINTPELSQRFAEALNIKVGSLILLERFDAAVEACDESLRRFGSDRRPSSSDSIATVLGFKAFAFNKLKRWDEAYAALDEAVQRLEESDSPSALETIANILSLQAQVELNGRRYESAITTTDRLLAQCADLSEYRWQAHLTRAQALLRTGGRSACEPDVEATLAILPKLDGLPPECLDTLMALSSEIGTRRMLELIHASPSATLLLPLATALEQDLGLAPRVAQEVDEVAQDIQVDLAGRKGTRSDDVRR